MSAPRCAVIGGGIIGVAVARELSYRLGARVTIYEKERRLAAHQTGHNSGVVHAGLYYEPGSARATLCRRGVQLLQEFCEQNELQYREVGKLLIAHDQKDAERLGGVFARAQANQVPGIGMLDAEGIQEREPHAVGVAALHSPRTAIVDYVGITTALAEDVVAAGGYISLQSEVTKVSSLPRGAAVHTASGLESYDLVVACAGLQSDRLARASSGGPDPRIVPFFGEYFTLDARHRDLVNGLIYPVPNPAYPFLGVHLTRRFDGEVLVGPNAFVAFAREAYSGNHINVRDVAALASFPGFWKFAARNLPQAAGQLRTLLSRRTFAAEAAEFIPALADAKLVRGPRGVRAQAMTKDGRLVDDFEIAVSKHIAQVRNAPSPGATSSLAIAEHVVDRLVEANGTMTGAMTGTG